MFRIPVVLLLFLILCAATSATAQSSPRPRVGSGRLWQDPGSRTDIVRSPAQGIFGDGSNDHRYTGMWIGLGLGAGLTALSVMFCADPDTGCEISRPLTYGPLMTFVLGVTGALIGAQIGRGAPSSPWKPDRTALELTPGTAPSYLALVPDSP